ncbi:MAG: response regulator transcription factor [Acidimicrobiales bacterium]
MNDAARPDVLIVDDERQVREVVATYLERAGFDVRAAADGRGALAEIARKRPDVLVLDLMLPGVDGLEVLRRLRDGGDEVPVIVLSARGSEPERVAGLELGADDYVAKPASPREIAARVKAVLRRARPSGPTTLAFGAVEIDVTSRIATKGGAPVELRPKEFDLLVRLASSPGEVLSRQDLLRDVWGSSSEWQDPGTVTVHVRRLRRAIEDEPASPVHIVTVYGVGYRFDASSDTLSPSPAPGDRPAERGVLRP